MSRRVEAWTSSWAVGSDDDSAAAWDDISEEVMSEEVMSEEVMSEGVMSEEVLSVLVCCCLIRREVNAFVRFSAECMPSSSAKYALIYWLHPHLLRTPSSTGYTLIYCVHPQLLVTPSSTGYAHIYSVRPHFPNPPSPHLYYYRPPHYSLHYLPLQAYLRP